MDEVFFRVVGLLSVAPTTFGSTQTHTLNLLPLRRGSVF